MEFLFTVAGIYTAIMVITSDSTVSSILWLIATFIIASIVLSLVHLTYVSLLYVIVYIGAIAILFLFVVQLLDLSRESFTKHVYESGPIQQDPWMYIGVRVSILGIILYVQATYNSFIKKMIVHSSFIPSQSTTNGYIQDAWSSLLIFSQNPNVGVLEQVDSIALWLYGPGILSFIIISFILLVAMIAPISLCKDNYSN